MPLGSLVGRDDDAGRAGRYLPRSGDEADVEVLVRRKRPDLHTRSRCCLPVRPSRSAVDARVDRGERALSLPSRTARSLWAKVTVPMDAPRVRSTVTPPRAGRLVVHRPPARRTSAPSRDLQSAAPRASRGWGGVAPAVAALPLAAQQHGLWTLSMTVICTQASSRHSGTTRTTRATPSSPGEPT